MAAADVYSMGTFPGSSEGWYHGKESRAKAEQALAPSTYDCFLVRQSRNGDLVLSLKYNAHICHIKIEYGPGQPTGRYRLYGSTHEVFTSIQDLVSYYRRMPISVDPLIMLGLACPMAGSKGLKTTGELPISRGSYTLTGEEGIQLVGLILSLLLAKTSPKPLTTLDTSPKTPTATGVNTTAKLNSLLISACTLVAILVTFQLLLVKLHALFSRVYKPLSLSSKQSVPFSHDGDIFKSIANLGIFISDM